MNRNLRNLSWAGGRRVNQVEDVETISVLERVGWGKKYVGEDLSKCGLFNGNRFGNDCRWSNPNVGFQIHSTTESTNGDYVKSGCIFQYPITFECVIVTNQSLNTYGVHNFMGYPLTDYKNEKTTSLTNGMRYGQLYVNPTRVGIAPLDDDSYPSLAVGTTYHIVGYVTQTTYSAKTTNLTTGTTYTRSSTQTRMTNDVNFLSLIMTASFIPDGVIYDGKIERIRTRGYTPGRYNTGTTPS